MSDTGHTTRERAAPAVYYLSKLKSSGITLRAARAGPGSMLVKVAEHIRVCIGQPREARERFAQVDDRLLKADFNDLEARWLRLAESYKFIEQLEVFLTDGKSFREQL